MAIRDHVKDYANRLLEVADAGHVVLAETEVRGLREAAEDAGRLRRDLDLIGWSALDYVAGRGAEMRPESRLQAARAARRAYLQDPLAAAAVDLMNDFVFGRGVPRPRARDKAVQEVIDSFWDDGDNQKVLTSYSAQMAGGTDLTLQSNIFFLVFDNGEDGKVKLSILPHDTVLDAVTDPDNEYRVLYYLSTARRREWDFQNDRPKPQEGIPKKLYYEHWQNLRQLDEAGEKYEKPPKDKLGEGRIYHIAVNRGTEQVFGYPSMTRLMRWYCHDEQTEALTADGWLGLDELERRAAAGALPRVAAFDQDSETLSYVGAKLHVFPYDGEMLHFEGARHTDALVTPNHRMLVRRDADARYGFVEAHDVKRCAEVWRIPVAAPLDGGTHVETFYLPPSRAEAKRAERHRVALAARSEGTTQREAAVLAGVSPTSVHRWERAEPDFVRPTSLPMNAFLAWLGWWVAEGHDAEVCQSVRSPRLAQAQEACDALGVPGREVTDGRMWRWTPRKAVRFREWLRDNCGTGARRKRLPEFVFSLAREQQTILLDGLMGGDGSAEWYGGTRGTYHTASPRLADDVQRLATNCGYRATVKRVSCRGAEHHRVHVVARRETRLVRPHREQYAGRVWCFETDLGTMVTRRNGKVLWAGNTAYNRFMEARVNMAIAASSFIMKRTVKGTGSQLTRLAQQAISSRSSLTSSVDDVQSAPPIPGAIINENDAVNTAPFNLNSGGAGAEQDGRMILGQISAGSGWPGHYLGDAGSSNLSEATAMELPVLKHVESRQEVWEAFFRDMLDYAIERAVEAGTLDRNLSGEELQEARLRKHGGEVFYVVEEGRSAPVAMHSWTQDGRRFLKRLDLVEANEDQTADENASGRDLEYDFSLPSPLRRSMTDLITACTTVAQVLDPNGTNIDLTRFLATIMFGEGLEVQNVADVVEQIWPPGYQDPALAAQQQGPEAPNLFGPGATGMPVPTGDFQSGSAETGPQGEGNPYGAPMRSTPAEQVPGMRESYYVTSSRSGTPVFWPKRIRESRWRELPDGAREHVARRTQEFEREWEETVVAPAIRAFMEGTHSNGNGKVNA